MRLIWLTTLKSIKSIFTAMPMIFSSTHTVSLMKQLNDSTCVQPLVTGWWFRDIGSTRTAVGHSLSLAR